MTSITALSTVIVPTRVFVGLGANLGNLQAVIAQAFEALGEIPGTRLLCRSSLYVTAPHDAGGPDYLNAVAELTTSLPASALLAHLHDIESRHGRERLFRNAPRTLDLDLLLYGESQLATRALTVPHPRLHERAFVLLPLAEIAPSLVVPGVGPVQELLTRVADQRIDKLP